MSHDEQFLAAMHREKIRLLRSLHAGDADTCWLMVAVVNQIIALETRIAQTAERAALLAELDAARQ